MGELSSSPLSTATAVTALAIVVRQSSPGASEVSLRIWRGLGWLAHHANADGGWGDTEESLSNISTTALGWAAFGAVTGADEEYRVVVTRAEEWLAARIGFTPHARRATRDAPRFTTDALVSAIIARYGKDRTFSVPILTTCALAGRLGPGKQAWRWVLPLPFELAACPHQWFAALRLPVVSYALPALIAIGQARHFHLPSRNPVARLARKLTRRRTLKILAQIQPSSGGFLEATPLTSFVVMSLAGSGQANHPVTNQGVEFLSKSQRADGSWAIDTNLATWVTTQAVDALANLQVPMANSSSQRMEQLAIGNWQSAIQGWLLRQQYRAEHPYTHAAPGGWAWTDLPGGVPDADDTAGAVLALAQMRKADSQTSCESGRGAPGAEILAAARAGIEWLLDLQNRDGGIPTFCRGWGALPFDRSSADLSAHAIRAWLAWEDELPWDLEKRIDEAISAALRFLAKVQRNDGAWIPLWFGNQFSAGEENLTYGTARVVSALCQARRRFPLADNLLAKGCNWLLAARNADGGWGGSAATPSSIEETALALEALAALLALQDLPAGIPRAELKSTVLSGTHWLLDRVESGAWTRPTPIGFYFAKLWYYEKLYPQIFTLAALGRVAQVARELTPEGPAANEPTTGVEQ